MNAFEKWSLIIDAMNVFVVTFIALGLAHWLPAQLQKKAAAQKRDAFVGLIRREIGKMKPDPKQSSANLRWCDHLKERFVHEAIFREPTPNRDFILSLDPELAYHEAQLWIAFDKADRAKNKLQVDEESRPETVGKSGGVVRANDDSQAEEDLQRHAEAWLSHLSEIARILDATPERKWEIEDSEQNRQFFETIYKPWEELIYCYYPKLNPAKKQQDGGRCDAKRLSAQP